MAQVINIQGLTAVDDPEYRYKMPSIQGKVEGRGNGIKTAIPNMTQVALALHRDPGEVTKFFGTELGAQTTWTPETERSIVNGAHTTNDLQQKVFAYIEQFVLCPNCRLPETHYSIKNGCIYHKCGACGAKTMVDMQHKLTTYILAQSKKKKKDGKDKKDKKDRKHKKDADASEDGEAKKDKKKKSKDQDKKKKKKKDKKDRADEEGEAGDEAEPSAAGAAAAAEEPDEEPEDEEEEGEGEDEEGAEEPSTLDALADEEMSAMETGIANLRQLLADESEASPDAIYERVTTHQAASMMPLSSCAYVMVQVFFDENIIKGGQIIRRAPALQRLVQSDANKFMARHLLGALEEFFCRFHTEKSNLFPLVLKQLYDLDVLEEEVILDWACAGVTHQFSPTSVSAPELNELRAAADKFIEWLREADEEEEEEEEETN